MKFWNAMRALGQGQKIRLDEWEEGSYIEMKANGDGSFVVIDNEGSIMDEQEVGPGDDWSLYVIPVKMHSFSEMIEKIRDGSEARRKGWEEKQTINYYDLCFPPKGANFRTKALFSIEEIEANDWIVIENS